MKLIDEKLIKQSAVNYAAKKYDRHDDFCNQYFPCREGFEAGVLFAEQQLKQKMIEFIDWYFENLTELEFKGLETTEQFLEEFITQQK